MSNRPRARALTRRTRRLVLIMIAAAAPGAALAAPAAASSVVAQASPSINLGAGTLRDVASVSGRVDPQPGATMTFRLYGPDDPTCSGTPLLGPAVVAYPVEASPSLLSPPFAPTRAGTYRWTAAYSGDVNNAAAATACGAPNQTTVVAKATTVVNVAPAAAGVAGAVTLTTVADVADRVSPTAGATIDFRLYGPTETGCTGAPVFESPGVPYPAAGGAVGSAPYAPPGPGVYRWTATYSGDANNEAAVSGCSAATTVMANAPPPCPTCAPRNSLQPVISGRAVKGRKLSCAAGVWTGVAPIAYAYRWLRDGTKIADGHEHEVVTADVRRKLVCEVTATNASGSATARSESVTPTATLGTVPIAVGGTIGIPRPAGVSARQACSGRVTLTLLRGSKRLGRRTVRLDARCRWSYTFRVSRTKLGTARKLRLRVRFGGNRYARPATFVRTIRLRG